MTTTIAGIAMIRQHAGSAIATTVATTDVNDSAAA